jgi:hypothetical protein
MKNSKLRQVIKKDNFLYTLSRCGRDWLKSSKRAKKLFLKNFSQDIMLNFTLISQQLKNCKVYLKPLSPNFQGNLQFFYFYSCSKNFVGNNLFLLKRLSNFSTELESAQDAAFLIPFLRFGFINDS